MEEGEQILEIIDNKKYEILYNKNSKLISTIKNDMLQKLQLSSAEIKNYINN